VLGGPPPSVCTHHARWSHVVAQRTCSSDVHGHILLWPPKYAQEWPTHAARLGCKNVAGTPAVGLHPPHPVVASWTHTVGVVWTSMATYVYGHPSTRTIGQCTMRGWEAEVLGGPPPSVCTHHARWTRRGRTRYPWFGLLWPHTSMATQVRARMASARGVVGKHKWSGDTHRRFAPTTPGGHFVDAHLTRGFDFYGHIRLWPPMYAHEWPAYAAWLGARNVGGIAAVSLLPPHPMVASWTHTVPVVWTSMATYFDGHPSTRTNGQCTRRGWDEEMLKGPPPSVCTHRTRWSRRGRTPNPWFGLLWPRTSMATQVRARMGCARGVVGMQKCWGDSRGRCAPTTPGGHIVNAHCRRGLDFKGLLLLWPPRYVHEWTVQPACLG